MRRRNFLAATAGFARVASTTAWGQSQAAVVASASGQLFREWWFEPGLEHANPAPNRRFRVNSPQVVLHESFGSRNEVKSSGMMQILSKQDPRECLGAELYLELWGGHPHTEKKRVTVNGRSTYQLPSALTAAGHCTHSYPTIPLRRTDLVNGYNALQFACDEGRSFWGHFIVDNACLRTEVAQRLDIQLRAAVSGGVVSFELGGADAANVEDFDVEAFYEGFPENGAESQPSWHGFSKLRKPAATVGTRWDSNMLPSQPAIARARARLKDEPASQFVTAATEAFRIGSEGVIFHYARELPVPFWSRANRKRTARIPVSGDLSRIRRAELHVVAWDGGRGAVDDYFKLNGKPLAICGEGVHDVIYSRIEIPAGALLAVNEIELLSDTEHHGIEILWPGPCLVTST